MRCVVELNGANFIASYALISSKADVDEDFD